MAVRQVAWPTRYAAGCSQQDEFTDASLEPAVDAYRRIDFRRRVRLAWHGQRLAACHKWSWRPISAFRARRSTRMLNNRFFGAAWADIEANSPFLVRRRVRFAELPRQIAYARQLLEEDAVPDAIFT